ncbi:glycine cleavage system protein GcvH [Microbacterium jejuense]|uniref:Glycine cleavage system H protein n=1 Tax=Microbacterium jejuense TaxID=1263637 RepID=A0ABS7HLJ6_9MICO|nr:glycine cleavage system protein GcvH [Microbacterium jejuense]MBW9093553.1 glycine cleavage system protein GcvH [Microbacterium jejuense]
MTDLTALKYTAEHEWIALDGDTATVGITEYAADKLGDVVFVELPAVGTAVTAATVVGEIESTKSVGELFAPLDGEVIAVNDAVVDDPSLVNADPFGAGWLVKLTVDPAAVDGLLDRDAYIALTGGAE